MSTFPPAVSHRVLPALVLFVLFETTLPRVSAQAPTTNRPWAYQLLEDSSLTDDCPICARPTIQAPMRGTFNLRLLSENQLFSTYALEDIQFTARGGDYHVTGHGTYQVGGEIALLQQMFLEVRVDNGFTSKLCYFTNASAVIERRWPMIDISLEQTNGTFAQLFSLRIAAAPLRDLWFSTVHSFTATSGPAPATFIEGGDLLARSGHVVKHNADLYTSVGAMPPGPDLGLDAVDILPGGEIAFSLDSDIQSKTLGPLQHGDLLSSRGHIILRNQELLAPFGVQPPAPDVGLDAVHFLESDEILFSIETNIFSERLGQMLHRGDLLSSTGAIVRTSAQWLAPFHPLNGVKEVGLDALYAWPSGEIWFSTEDAFEDSVLGPIQPGDLLSDQGYIVFRNRDLLAAFGPQEDFSDFGLDAVYIITDATPAALEPHLAIAARPLTQSAHLTWEGKGRVFQVERADLVTGPFQPASPILPDLFWDDIGALTNRAQSYYRLHQW